MELNKLDTVKKELVHMRIGQNKPFQMKYKGKNSGKDKRQENEIV